MIIEKERVGRGLQSYIDQCIVEAIRTECPQIKDFIHEMVRSLLQNDESAKAAISQFGVKADTEPVPAGNILSINEKGFPPSDEWRVRR